MTIIINFSKFTNQVMKLQYKKVVENPRLGNGTISPKDCKLETLQLYDVSCGTKCGLFPFSKSKFHVMFKTQKQEPDYHSDEQTDSQASISVL